MCSIHFIFHFLSFYIFTLVVFFPTAQRTTWFCTRFWCWLVNDVVPRAAPVVWTSLIDRDTEMQTDIYLRLSLKMHIFSPLTRNMYAKIWNCFQTLRLSSFRVAMRQIPAHNERQTHSLHACAFTSNLSGSHPAANKCENRLQRQTGVHHSAPPSVNSEVKYQKPRTHF